MCGILKNYILLTPVRNEEAMLPKVAENIIQQTIRPALWVIIDGNSSDQTFKIAQNLSIIHNWIRAKTQEQFSSVGGHINFSLALHEAYRYAIDITIKDDIAYSYVGKIDADQILPVNFFEYLMHACNDKEYLGAVSGKAYSHSEFGSVKMNGSLHKNLIEDKYPQDELPDKRLYRKEALDDIGGFPLTKYSPDTVVLAKMRMRGWKIKTFPEVKVINLRKDTGIEKDRWKSALQIGKSRFYLGYHPLLLILGCIYVFVNEGIIQALGIFFGYCVSWAKREEIITDRDIWNYFRYKRIREILHQILDFRNIV